MADYRPIPHPPAPHAVPPMPRYTAVERLADALLDADVPERAAKAIAMAVTDPAAFRRAMQAPTTVHTASGDLAVVHTRVWTLAVIPHPLNLRLSPRVARSFSGAGRRTLGRAVSGPNGAAELVVPSPGAHEVASTLSEAVMMLAQDNPLANDIAIDGVIEPLTLVPLTFEHDTGADDVTVLSAVDGSSRVAGAYENLSIRPEQVVYTYATDHASLRGRIGRWLQLAKTEPADLDDTELGRLNSITMPAAIVIGFTPGLTSRSASFVRVIDARVGSIHVAPPTAWSLAARSDAQLEAVLETLEAEGAFDPEWTAYYAGDLTPEAAEAEGFSPDPDVRSAHLLADLHRPSSVRTIHEALRTVAVRQPSYRDRAALAAEGALHAFRNQLNSSQVDAARNLLTHVYAMEEFRNEDWYFDEVTSLNVLLQHALAGNRDAARNLLALAVYWMARFAVIRRTTRGGETDRRDITLVLRALLEDDRGLRQLHRIIADARAGRPPRRVSEDGRDLAVGRDDGDVPFTEDWLRRTWGGSYDGNGSPGSQARQAGPRPKSPEADLRLRFDTVKADLADIVEHVKKLLEPTGPDGRPVVLRLGLDQTAVDELLQQWTIEVAGPLTHYRYIAGAP